MATLEKPGKAVDQQQAGKKKRQPMLAREALPRQRKGGAGDRGGDGRAAKVMKAGENPSSAMRVTGRVAPKMTTPMKPSARPASGCAVAFQIRAGAGEEKYLTWQAISGAIRRGSNEFRRCESIALRNASFHIVHCAILDF
jgi:hypothetical protein